MPSITLSNAESSMPSILTHISPTSLANLQQEISTIIHPQTMFWYSINFSVFLFSFWATALCLHDIVLPSRFILGQRWEKCDGNRRTMIVYLLSVLITFICLILQIASSDIFFLNYRVEDMNMIRASSALITSLYLFEMIYRERMRFAMLCHHCLTMFAIGFVMVLMDKTQDPSFVITGSLWLFQATTEQLTFVALFGYRLEWAPRVLRPMLRIAAVQSLLVKMASLSACIFVWFKYQKSSEVVPTYNHAWDAVIWIAALGLMFTQFWGSWVVWKMGASLEARYESKKAQRGALYAQQLQQPSNTEIMLDREGSRSAVMVTPALSLHESINECSSLYYNSRSDSIYGQESYDKSFASPAVHK